MIHTVVFTFPQAVNELTMHCEVNSNRSKVYFSNSMFLRIKYNMYTTRALIGRSPCLDQPSKLCNVSWLIRSIIYKKFICSLSCELERISHCNFKIDL